LFPLRNLSPFSTRSKSFCKASLAKEVIDKYGGEEGAAGLSRELNKLKD